MTARARLTILAALLCAAAAGCGQQGPLRLPNDARPIERIDPQEPASEPVDTDDETEDER
jgi:predicted small lipoprotein YifL